jgi:hypothetical protein
MWKSGVPPASRRRSQEQARLVSRLYEVGRRETAALKLIAHRVRQNRKSGTALVRNLIAGRTTRASTAIGCDPLQLGIGACTVRVFVLHNSRTRFLRALPGSSARAADAFAGGALTARCCRDAACVSGMLREET